jgi:hypothetical protein
MVITPADSATLGRLWRPGRSRATVLKSLLVRARICLIRTGERIRRVANFTPRSSSSPRTGWVVTLWSMVSMRGSDPEAAFQWSQNAITSRFWLALVRSALA